jgi:hypothetical protein
MEDQKLPIMEGYADPIIKRIIARDQKRKDILPKSLNGHPMQLVLEDLLLWDEAVLTVSFKEGTTALHRQIEAVASEWSKYANIKFDFGYDTSKDSYRSWVPNDTSSIRVGFADAGYWSFVGTDSLDPEICSPGDITLNLEKFDVDLPAGWQATVLHEFGHALGFHHEHQSPVSQCDFDWDKLYAYLAGPPNFWSKEKVDFNLKQMPAGGLSFSPYDKQSIMHYSFPEWMFIRGIASPCFIELNDTLSEEDKKMAAKAYPSDENLTTEMRIQRQSYIVQLLKLSGSFDKIELSVMHERLSGLRSKLGKRHAFIGLENASLSVEVKRAILIAGGQASEDPKNMADNIAIGNLLPTSYAYQFLADLLDQLVKSYNKDGAVKLTEVSAIGTVLECVQMVQSKI